MKDLQNLCINTIVQHWRRLSPVLELPSEYNIQILQTCVEQENVDVLQQILLSKEVHCRYVLVVGDSFLSTNFVPQQLENEF